MTANSKELVIKIINQESQNVISEFFNQGGTTIIASALTVIATLIAVYCTNRNQKKIEARKVKREKLEELHQLIYDSGKVVLVKRNKIEYLNYNSVLSLFSDFYNTKTKIEVLINLYFKKELEAVSNQYIKSLEFIFKCLKLRFENKIIDGLHEDVQSAQDQLSYASNNLDEYLTLNPEGVIERELQYYIENQDNEDLELAKAIMKLSNEETKFKETRFQLEKVGNPSIVELIDKMDEYKSKLLKAIVKEVERSMK